MAKNTNDESFCDVLRKMHESRGIGSCLNEDPMSMRDSNVINDFDHEHTNDEDAEFEFLLQEDENDTLDATHE